jgi:hypothetical protein
VIRLRLTYATALVSLSSCLTDLARALADYSQSVLSSLEADL